MSVLIAKPFYNNVGRISGKCESEGEKQIHSYTWVIENFSSCQTGVGGWLQSPEFSTGNEYKWTLDLFVDGYTERTREYAGIRPYWVNKTDSSKGEFYIECAILDENNKKKFSDDASFTHETLNETSGIFKRFISKCYLMKNSRFLPNNELRILCQISFHVLKQNYADGIRLGVLSRLLDDAEFSDFSFFVGEKEFRVHRAILAASSPVFREFFNSEIRESSEKKLEIDDVEPDVMEKLLRFVYIGEVDVKSLSDKILIVADKYDLQELKQLCEDTLSQKLNIDNVYSTLQLAEKYNADELKQKAIKFFNSNRKELSAQANFEETIGSLSCALQTQIICTFAKEF